jgi:hypothetical protein
MRPGTLEHRVNLPLWVRLFRVAFGALALVAVWRNRVDHHDDPHFFDYFTNQSNIIAGVVLILGGSILSRRNAPPWWDYVRGATVMTMVTTGAVYALLLGGLYNPFGDAHPWMDSVLHQLIPVIMLVDLLIAPLGRRVAWWAIGIFMAYPLAYLGLSLLRGAGSGWYPYDFMDPAQNGGYDGVAITIGMLTVGFLAISAGVIAFSRTVAASRT